MLLRALLELFVEATEAMGSERVPLADGVVSRINTARRERRIWPYLNPKK